jgi:hypothetical protein
VWFQYLFLSNKLALIIAFLSTSYFYWQVICLCSHFSSLFQNIHLHHLQPSPYLFFFLPLTTKFLFFLVFFLIIHLFTCAYIVWVISSLYARPPLCPGPPHFQAESVLPLSLIFLKKRHKHNKEDKVFL